MTKIVNLSGGPSSRKSYLRASLYSALSALGFSVEEAYEFAKELVWDNNLDVLKCQPHVMTEQYRRLYRLIGKVDVVVTDSPLFLSCLYSAYKYPPSFKQFTLDLFKGMDNLTYFVKRVGKYNPNGRVQTEQEAILIDHDIFNLLEREQIPYKLITGDEEGLKFLVDDVQRRLAGKS